VSTPRVQGREVAIPADGVTLEGTLSIPGEARGIVAFAHGSGSSRFSPRNRFVAEVLRTGGFGTLLMDLLSAQEERLDERTRAFRFDIDLLTERTVKVVDWLAETETTGDLAVGLFGASTGAAAALGAAAARSERVSAVVSRGGRPDLAEPVLDRVRAATLLLVGARDPEVLRLNRKAFDRMTSAKARHLEVVPGATHLFEEPGTLERVAEAARAWFGEHAAGSTAGPPPTG
jgi:putative phosphoribosyl transferase